MKFKYVRAFRLYFFPSWAHIGTNWKRGAWRAGVASGFSTRSIRCAMACTERITRSEDLKQKHLGQRAKRDLRSFRVHRELLLSQLRSDSEGSADFTIDLGEDSCSDGSSDRSLDRRIQEEVIDELCWADEAHFETGFEDGCSLQEARAFCRMCLRHADRLRLARARQLGEDTTEVQSPSALTRRIKDHEEARNFALICLKAIEEYEAEGP
eukprot:s140_g19.t1